MVPCLSLVSYFVHNWRKEDTAKRKRNVFAFDRFFFFILPCVSHSFKEFTSLNGSRGDDSIRVQNHFASALCIIKMDCIRKDGFKFKLYIVYTKY